MTGHTRELLLMVGESGSGKSTFARDYCQLNPGSERISRDDLRIELAGSAGAPTKGRDFESYVVKIQKLRAAAFLAQGKNVVIDDTNLNPNTRDMWRNFANHRGAFRIHRMMTSLADCIANDAKRSGKAHVGRAVIERQFLLSKRLYFETNWPVVIVDMDGTLANHEGIRSPYDEGRVHLDRIYEVVAEWVRTLSTDHIILIVSGRHSTCGDLTIQWLEQNNIPFNHIFMRHGWDHRHDTIVKQEILNELLGIIDPSRIKFILDDRPQVVRMWKQNGLTVYPVRGTIDHAAACGRPNKPNETCQECGAIGDF